MRLHFTWDTFDRTDALCGVGIEMVSSPQEKVWCTIYNNIMFSEGVSMTKNLVQREKSPPDVPYPTNQVTDTIFQRKPCGAQAALTNSANSRFWKDRNRTTGF